MFRFITETFHRLIDELPPMQTRYLYPEFQLRNRLTGLIGPRGVGKTTLLLQYIKNELYKDKKSFYFSADLVYFQQANLLEFVSDLHQKEGYKIIFIDEIHKYQGWDQELKNIYDSFPSLKIVFSGSSMLDLYREGLKNRELGKEGPQIFRPEREDVFENTARSEDGKYGVNPTPTKTDFSVTSGIVAGSYDLSRRAKLYRLHGLSFREYLNFSQNLHLKPCSFHELIYGITLPEVPKILTHFETYLSQGYYPFVFEDPHSYHEKVSRIIEKTIFEDIANYYNLKTPNLQYFKKILTYLASIPPGELNIHNLSQSLEIDHKTAQHYLTILASVGLIRELHPYEGGGAGLRKSSKFLLNNTTLMHTMQQYLGQPILKGTERELFFVQSLQNAEIPIFCSSKADYRTKDALFEIGGKSKTQRQLKGATLPAYLVKDDILHALRNEIPLFQCGFLY